VRRPRIQQKRSVGHGFLTSLPPMKK